MAEVHDRWLNRLLAGVAVLCGLTACGGSAPSADAADAASRSAQPLRAASRGAQPLRAASRRPLPDFTHMRAVHMMGNWLGNPRGFQAPVLIGAPSLTASQVSIRGSLSRFTDGAGVSHTNDLAVVTLTNVHVGSLALAKAGFWVVRDTATGAMGLQFRPQFDPDLAGIGGFAGDVNVSMAPQVDAGQISSATGDARALIAAVIAHAPELLASATATLDPGTALGQPATLGGAMASLRTALDSADATYFAYLRSMNVEWIGISVGIHYDSFSDPTVRARNCTEGHMLDSGGNPMSCAFPDADLTGFITRARAAGFKVYLTLAFESSVDIDSTSSPACHTSNYKMSRWWLGAPELPADRAVGQCVPQGAWWWNPSHPDHAAKVQTFFSSYQDVAVKYAALAESAGVDLFSLGTETENLFRTRTGTRNYTNHFRTQLQSMTAAVRQVYGGAVTYDQHFDSIYQPQFYGGAAPHEELFNDLDLDVVGISAYFPLASSPPNGLMSVAQLEAAWENIFGSYLQPLRTHYPAKPIVFTEVGYTDDVNSPYDQGSNASQPKPPHAAGSDTPGMTQQGRIYEAFFNVNARHADLIAGTFFWGNDYFPFNPVGCSVVDWGLRCNAPARTVVTNTYAAWQRKDADRVFNWAQSVFPDMFGAGSSGGVGLGYYFRYYPATGTYLGLQEATGDVFVHNGQRFQFSDVGSLRGFLDLGARAGY